jgi:hypothetical protein
MLVQPARVVQGVFEAERMMDGARTRESTHRSSAGLRPRKGPAAGVSKPAAIRVTRETSPHVRAPE